METKKCDTCGTVLPATTEYFYWNKQFKYLRNNCKTCMKKSMLERYHRLNPKVEKVEVVPVLGQVDCPGMRATHGKCATIDCRYHMLNGTNKKSVADVLRSKYTCLFEIIETFPEGLSHSQIGAIMGISQQRVQQIEARALEKLRKTARHMEDALAEDVDTRYHKPHPGSIFGKISDMAISPLPFGKHAKK